MAKVTFIGGGSFGTALAILLANKGDEVNIYDKNKEIIDEINVKRTNERYIKNLNIPKNVTGFYDLKSAMEGAEYIVLAVPSHVVRVVSKEIKPYTNKDSKIVSIAKGLEPKTNLRLSEVIEQELGVEPVVLSGPSHAEEVAIGILTTIVVSSKNMKLAEEIQDLFMTNTFRVYTNSDLIGVEIGGAVKNVIALAAGVLDGIGCGDNTKAGLMTRGMNEMARIGAKLGGKVETFFGLTGMGDLIVTCTSMHSRNRRAGILLGKGKTLEEATKEVGMVVEGVKACQVFHDLSKELNVSMPITETLYQVAFENKNVKEAVQELMIRDKKSETIYQ